MVRMTACPPWGLALVPHELSVARYKPLDSTKKSSRVCTILLSFLHRNSSKINYLLFYFANLIAFMR